MKKALFTYILCAGVVAFSQIKRETILSTDFEGDATQILEVAKIDCSVSEVVGKDAIKGEKSLMLDSSNNKNWCSMLKVDLSGADGYRVAFKYRVLSVGDVGKICSVIRINKDPETKSPRALTVLNLKRSGKVEYMDDAIWTSSRDEKYHFDFTSHRGAKIIIDDLKVEKLYRDKSAKGAWMFEPDAFVGMRYLPTNYAFCGVDSPFLSMSKEEFFPFIDRFGQFKHKDWVDKIHSVDDLKKQIEIEKEFNKKYGKIPQRDKFGGYLNPKYKYEATGRFRVQKINGYWYFITPEGNLFFSNGITCAGIHDVIPYTYREHYFEDISDKRFIKRNQYGLHFYKGKKHDSYGFIDHNLTHKYGEKYQDVYGGVADERMRVWGFNTYGAWSQAYIMKRENVPYSATLTSYRRVHLKTNMEIKAYWSDFPDYFAPDFEPKTRERIAQSAKLLRSPMCMGAFIDNELSWQLKPILIIQALLTCPADQPAKIEFMKFLQKKYGTIEKLNPRWKSNYKSWDDFLKQRKFYPKTQSGRNDMLAFEEKMYEHYFRVCRDALKAVDPQALYLGCRFAWRNELVQKVASRYVDVVSYNIYDDNITNFRLPKGCVDKPILIGEYHFGTTDKGSFGGGLNPRRTTKERAEAFEEYLTSAIENPNVAGAHYFAWFDLSPAGRFNMANFSMGFLDICDTPDYVIVKKANKLARKFYKMRLSGKKTTVQGSSDNVHVLGD
ncbi:MAG: hypothetical protein E7036_09165 [Opitutales bacterium]|nr:hypothetical protein [Opitutales bacterium]